MLRRLLAAALGLGVAAGLTFGLDQLFALPYALAIGVGIAAGVFLVVDGSAGAGEGWVYHEARPRSEQIRDFQWTAGVGAAIGLALAYAAAVVELGRIPAAVMVVLGTLIAANMVFLWRRPAYEQMLDED